MFAEGRVFGEEGLQIAAAVAHPESLVNASHGIGMLYLRQGDLSRALPLLERAVDLCHEADLSGWFPMVANTLVVLGRSIHTDSGMVSYEPKMAKLF